MTELSSNGIRILAAILLFVLTLLMGTLPVHLVEFFSKKNRKENVEQSSTDCSDNRSRISLWLKQKITKEGIVQFLTQVGGGVLFYTAFVHMLPEILENYEKYLNENSTLSNSSLIEQNDEEEHSASEVPVVQLCVCAGFFGIFLIEEFMHSVLLKNHDHHHHSSTKENPIPNSQVIGKILSHQKYCKTRHYSKHVDEPGVESKSTVNQECNETLPISTINQCGGYNSCSLTNVTCDNQAHCTHTDNTIQIEHTLNDKLATQEESTDSVWKHLFDCFLIILAFSCHAIFDGISIGVQESPTEIWQLLIAILSHKLLIAFILSFQIYEKCFQRIINPNNPLAIAQKRPIKQSILIRWCFSALFALMSPIGILLVMTMNSTADAPTEANIRVVLLAAVSVGTIMYIVFVEIMDKSTSRTHISGLIQWIALVIGFASMYLVSMLFHEKE